MNIKYKNILFVCTGNTCRSPMAEALLKKMIKERFPSSYGEVAIGSAGTAAYEGAPATAEAQEAVKKMGADLSAHKARAVNEKILDGADIIFAMARRHYDELAALRPDIKDKVFVLRQYAGQTGADIDDPIGAPLEVYEECAGIIEECLGKILERRNNS